MPIPLKKHYVPISDNVIAELDIDLIDYCESDTRVIINGEWWISGATHKEFCEKLGALIDEYRI